LYGPPPPRPSVLGPDGLPLPQQATDWQQPHHEGDGAVNPDGTPRRRRRRRRGGRGRGPAGTDSGSAQVPGGNSPARVGGVDGPGIAAHAPAGSDDGDRPLRRRRRRHRRGPGNSSAGGTTPFHEATSEGALGDAHAPAAAPPAAPSTPPAAAPTGTEG